MNQVDQRTRSRRTLSLSGMERHLMNHRSWYTKLLPLVAALLAIGWVFVRTPEVTEIHRENEQINFSLVKPTPGRTDWPQARGIDGTSVATESNPPTEWSPGNNVEWTLSVPGSRCDAPCTWDDRLFFVNTDDSRGTISLQSIDRKTGRSFWQSELHRGTLAKPSTILAGSPACDGQRVFVAANFEEKLVVSAVDFKGRIIWKKIAGPSRSHRATIGTAIISGSLVIVDGDDRQTDFGRTKRIGYLTALHRQTGEIIWRIKRPQGDIGGLPVVAHIAGVDQLIIPGRGSITSYDPSSGRQRWRCRWSAERSINSIAYDSEYVFAATQSPRPELIAVRADGTDDVTESHVLWKEKGAACGTASPLFHDGFLYTLSDEGALSCVAPESGKIYWTRRLSGKTVSSPLIAGGNIYCQVAGGKTHVFRLDGRGERVSLSTVATDAGNDQHESTSIVSGDRIYLRTPTGLHCVSDGSDETLAESPEHGNIRL